MALNAITWFYLISSTFTALFSLGFSVTMTASFFRKRSIGSSFMMVAFGMIAFGEMFYSISLWLGAFNVGTIITIGILQALFINFICLAILYFYYFSTRHILRDNELVKSILIVLSTETIAVVTTLMFTTVLGGEILVQGGVQYFLAGTDITVFAPTWIFLIILFTPLVNFMLIRIIANLAIIRDKITDAVSRRGTLFITLSVISLTLSISFLTPYLIPAVNNFPAIIIILQLLRLIATFFAMIFGYLGWVFPEWLKKRIRGKAWIVQAFKKIEGKELDYEYSTSSSTEPSKIVVKEVSDP
ncbi:MAG: hypothetical protein EAX90_11320 [Candidatus Heimdallarchaeota archaeon]|nr:hypothetical protein [Candidatus Heimdallarchaeota archaeon]